MHVRFRSCIGMPVLPDGGDMVLATLSGVLIHPDTGKIEGFFAHDRGSKGLFFSSKDIVRFGTRIYIRDEDALAPSDDHIRLATLLDDPRTFLGQKIRTESGGIVGRCIDVQFNTESMHVEWLFPRKWFRWGRPLPIASVLEIRPDAIIVREAEVPEKQSLLRGEVLKAEMPVAQPSRSLRGNLFR